MHRQLRRESPMDFWMVLLTLAVFAVLAVIVRGAEKL
jgi:hypothetical protein